MAFLDFFKNEPENSVQKYNTLFKELSTKFPTIEEDELLMMSCVAGLFARVAYVDFDLDPKEMDQMQSLIKDWHFSSSVDSKIVAQLAVENIKEMAGLENHLFIRPLKERFSKDERFSLLKALFLVAAADGSVESVEAEEIRRINKGLELSQQHFIAARAEVIQYLKTLE